MKNNMRRVMTMFAAAFAAVVPSIALAQTPRPKPEIETIAERTRACTACHGKEGRATSEGFFPRIAGKPEGYLFNQMVNFRDGRRQNTPMIYMVQHMPDSYLHEIAQYFSSLDLPYSAPHPGVGSADMLKLGEALALHGDTSRKIPACVQCHGTLLTGVAPSMPGLLGLPRDYVIGQFGAWRSGQRKTPAPDCMAEIAKRLAPDEVGAVAAWLASQKLPTVSKPADKIDLPLPMECGSGLKP